MTAAEKRLKQQLAWAYRCDPDGTREQVARFAEGRRRKYSDWYRYRYYHVLLGSIPTVRQDREDFPNGEVAAFVGLLSRSEAFATQSAS